MSSKTQTKRCTAKLGKTEADWERCTASRQINLPILLFADIKLGEERTQVYLIAAPGIPAFYFLFWI